MLTRTLSLNIFAESKVAIRAITTRTVKSQTVLECKKEINAFSENGVWVPGHSGVRWNEKADDLAQKAFVNPKPLGWTQSEFRVKTLCGDPDYEKTSL